MDIDLQNKIDLFLKKPNDFPLEGRYSTLYLLRRDTSLCFGFHPDSREKIPFEALFPATMAILAGIDLMAKFVEGNDVVNGVGTRFRNYVNKYIDSTHSEVLYQLRNSLLHSFGLFSTDKNKKIYRFKLTRGVGFFIKPAEDNFYIVDIDVLWGKFEESIECYHNDLLDSEDLQQKFSKMYEKYGTIRIG